MAPGADPSPSGLAREPDRHVEPREAEAVREAMERLDARFAFGPGFFVGQLGSFVRDRCPDPAEGLPHVEIHVFGGEAFEVCHVIGVAPHWVALAVFEVGSAHPAGTMRTELVPYEAIVRVTVRGDRPGSARVGFHQERTPIVRLTPEQALAAAAGGSSIGDHAA
jgi:hypothetical protein